MKKITQWFKDFAGGYKEGIEDIKIMTKLPTWGCYTLAILLLPLNLIILAVILLKGGVQGLNDWYQNKNDVVDLYRD